MKHYYHYRPKDAGQPVQERDASTSGGRRTVRSIRRPIMFSILGLLLLLALLSGGVYLYVTRTPIDNSGGRTNVLLLGVDEAAQLSDTILLASIRSRGQERPEVVLVSIPRDLYVDIPGHGRSKVNAAYSLGERTGHSGGGPGMTVDIIEQTFDLPIHYYAALDFKGFRKIIDAVGGITIDVETAIDDPYYPAPGYDGYNPFSIGTGRQHMDGERALKYARSRKTTNDYDRAYRQQQVILGIKNKLFRAGFPPVDPGRARALSRAIRTHVDSNMNRLEMLRLAYALRDIETGSVPRYVLDTTNFLASVPGGSGLVPESGDFESVRQFLDEVFAQQSVEEFQRQF